LTREREIDRERERERERERDREREIERERAELPETVISQMTEYLLRGLAGARYKS